MSCGVSRRHDSDLVLLWLWCRLAAIAPMGPPTLGISICYGYGPKKTKDEKKEKKTIIGRRYILFKIG